MTSFSSASYNKLATAADKNLLCFADMHYYLNLDRCAHGGIRPVASTLDGMPMIRGAEVFAVNNNCTTVYYHAEAWEPYTSGREITCSSHP